MDPYSIALVVAAIIAAIPATIAARASLSSSRQLKPSNGMTTATTVEEIRSEQVKIALVLLAAQEDAAEERAERRQDRRTMQDHIKADLEWQSMVEPYILGARQRDVPGE